MKRILFLLCAVLLVGSADAGVKVEKITTASLADDALDTLFIDISDAAIFDTSGTPALHFSLGNLETAAAESIQTVVSIGYAYDEYANTGGATGGAWSALYALANDNSNLAPQEVKALTSSIVGPHIRLIVKNVSGGALAAKVRFSYATVD